MSNRKLARGIFFAIREILRGSDNGLLGRSAILATKILRKIPFLNSLPLGLRIIISLSQPRNPLRHFDLPTINVAIPCHQKDFKNLNLVIQGVQHSVQNPIGEIQIITPQRFADELRHTFPKITVLTDEELLSIDIKSMVSNHFPPERWGWLYQQALKFLITLRNETIATLVLDADTILLQPRVWIDCDQVQALDIAYEFHKPYKAHQKRHFKAENSLLSYVTHYQLMKKDVVTNIFGVNGEDLVSWISAGFTEELSPMADYDTYGEWMTINRPREVRYTKWNNVPKKLDQREFESYEQIRRQFSIYSSISNHTYLTKT